MKITAFNDIVKGLEGAGTTNKNEEIEELAEKLHKQGITTSLLEAKEKAKSMLTTESSTKNEEKMKKATTYNDPRNNPNYSPYKAAMIEEMRKRAVQGRQAIQIQDEFQTPSYEERNPNQVHSRAVVNSSGQMRRAPAVSIVPKQHTQAQRPAPQVHSATYTPDAQDEEEKPEISLDLEEYDVQEQEEKVIPRQKPVEASQKREEPVKKEQPKIDLASVFSFGKK